MDFKLFTLGTSAATPQKDRNPTANVLQVKNNYYLFDAGEGVQRSLMFTAIKPTRIVAVFITHLHGDHYFGLFGLLTSMALHGRKLPLTIVAPKSLRPIVEACVCDEGTSFPFQLLWLDSFDSTSEYVYEDNNVVVRSFDLEHRIPTRGYLLAEKEHPYNLDGDKLQADGLRGAIVGQLKLGHDVIEEGQQYLAKDYIVGRNRSRSFGYCTDTIYLEQLVSVLRDVTLLYHEATFLDADKTSAVRTKHTTALEAGRLARLSNAAQLVISHFSARYERLDDLLEEAQQEQKNTFLAKEGAVFDVPLVKEIF